jgi:outer membrane protein insertion porin family
MGGVVHPLPFLNQSSSPSATFLTDRFYFGTPLTMRGFERCSFGVVEHEDNLGGEVVAGAAASVSWAATKDMNSSGIRFHSFVNAGNLVPLNRNSLVQGTIQDLYDTARVSVGTGVVVPTPIGRLEINVATPILKQAWDRTRRFQFGLDLQFH